MAAEDKISLDVQTHAKFCVWVSFCEIYNENIHDLLEVASGGALRRAVLRLSQDVRGNAFVKGSSSRFNDVTSYVMFNEKRRVHSRHHPDSVSSGWTVDVPAV